MVEAVYSDHKLVLAFNGNDMLRIYHASRDVGLPMEDWAAAIVRAAAADIAQRSRRPSTDRGVEAKTADEE